MWGTESHGWIPVSVAGVTSVQQDQGSSSVGSVRSIKMELHFSKMIILCNAI